MEGSIKSYTKFPLIHTYNTPDVYNVKISNTLSSINFTGNDNSNSLKKQLRYIINLGDQIATLEDDCFNDCINLISCNASNNITYIGDRAFKNCRNLTYFSNINDNNSEKQTLKYIGESAFENCNSLISVSLKIDGTLWDSSLGSKFMVSAFANCENLMSVIYEQNSSPFMNDCTFANCPKLKYVELYGYSTIASRVFMNCTGLERIDFPSSWKNGFGTQFFSGCTSLTSINISSVTDSGNNYNFNVASKVFEYCDNLSTITFPPILTSMNSFSNMAFLNSNFKEIKFLGLSKTDTNIRKITETNALGLAKPCNFIFMDNSNYMFTPGMNEIEISPDFKYFYTSASQTNFNVGNGIWYMNFENARNFALQNNYVLLIFFSGGSGCGPCQTAKSGFFNTDILYKGTIEKNNLLLLYLDPEHNNAEYEKCKKYISVEKRIAINSRFPIFYMEYTDTYNNQKYTYKRINDSYGAGKTLKATGESMLDFINTTINNWI